MKKALKLAKLNLIGSSVFLAAILFFANFVPASAQTIFDDAFDLTQTSATIGVNQRITVVSFGGYNLKVSGGGRIVKATVAGGNQISLYGASAGKAVVKVCNEDLGCRNINVTVQRTKVSMFKLYPVNLTLKGAQEAIVASSYGKNLIARSNSGAAKAYVKNNKVYVSGERKGVATITVCSSNLGCLPVYVKVTSSRPVISGPGSNPVYENGTDAALVLNTQNVTVQQGKSVDIAANILTGLTAESSTGAARTAVNGNRITIYGTYIGTASVKVCKPGKNCVAVSVNVTEPDSAYTSVSGDLRVSDSKLELFAGQKAWVNVYGAKTFKVYTSNSYVAKPSVKGSLILVNTYYTGKANVTVCSEDDGCVVISVLSKTNNVKKVTGTMRTIDQPKGTTKSYNFSYYYVPTTYYLQNYTNNNLLSVSMKAGNPFDLVVSTFESGNSIITICPFVSGYNCGTVGINITDPLVTDPTQKVALSDNLVTVAKGEAITVTANMNYSLAAFSDNDSTRTAVNGNQITLYGIQLGKSLITVCSTNGSCATVTVRVVDKSQI